MRVSRTKLQTGARTRSFVSSRCVTKTFEPYGFDLDAEIGNFSVSNREKFTGIRLFRDVDVVLIYVVL